MNIAEFFETYFIGENEEKIENDEIVYFNRDWRDEFILDEFINAMNFERSIKSEIKSDELLLFTKTLIRDIEHYIKFQEFNLKKDIELKREEFDMIEGLRQIIDELNWKRSKLVKYYEEFEKELIDKVGTEFKSIYKSSSPKNSASKNIINKFIWNDTEENLLILIEHLINAGLIDNSCLNKRYAILRDTFLNKNQKRFNHRQLSVINTKIDTNRIKNSTNFQKFINSLSKLQN